MVRFNASWILEIQQIELINKLCKDGLLKGTKYKEKRLHLIRNDEFMEAIGATSKIVPSRDFLLACTTPEGRPRSSGSRRISTGSVSVPASM